MHTILKNAQIALQSMREQWQRALLSALGVMVGAVAIILLVSIATGVQQDVSSQVEDIGVNVLIVVPGRVEEGMFNPNIAGMSYLSEEDGIRLAEVPGVIRTAALTFAGGGVRWKGKEAFTPLVIAATPSWFQMHKAALKAGQVFGEDQRTADVCVIGSVAQKQLFGDKQRALGERVQINGRTYTIIGVTEDRKSEESLFSMGGFQNVVYIPYHALKRHEPEAQTNRVMVQSRPEVDPKRLKADLEAVLARSHDRQQFSVLTQEDLLGLVFRLMSILTWLLTGLTSIALFVGGVGIMTVMLMSVNERSKEIGIRKTTGARRADIFAQFLFEAVAVSLLGGAVGLGLSWLVCLALRTWTPVKPLITFGIVGLAFAVSVGVGAVFGLLPAMRAARKDPVDALRNE